MEIALLGHMGRDHAAADRLKDHKLHVMGQWVNPGLAAITQTSGGHYDVVDSIKNVEAVADWVEAIQPDMFFTNFDDALAAGVVDAIRRRAKDKGFDEPLMPCPDQKAAQPEADKFLTRHIVEKIKPEYNPLNYMVQTSKAGEKAVDFFESEGVPLVLKPRNLAGGKGVRVQGKHFDSYAEARVYMGKILNDSSQSGLEIQERLIGHEFTLQILTDGQTIIEPPTTYDYAYRHDGDTGPGTGGMGAFSMAPGEYPPFLSEADYLEVIDFSKRMLQEFKDIGIDFKGVFYPSFIKTADGIKLIEINARGGDPELINTLDLLEDDVDYANVLANIATGTLQVEDVRYKSLASATIYLVAPEYGYDKPGQPRSFALNPELVKQFDCRLRFAAAELDPEESTDSDTINYRSVGSSRTLALSASAKKPWVARRKITVALDYSFVHPLELDHRKQIAQKEYIESLVL